MAAELGRHCTAKQWNAAIDLWNDGLGLGEIAARTQVPFWSLSRLLVPLITELAHARVAAGVTTDEFLRIPDCAKLKESADDGVQP